MKVRSAYGGVVDLTTVAPERLEDDDEQMADSPSDSDLPGDSPGSTSEGRVADGDSLRRVRRRQYRSFDFGALDDCLLGLLALLAVYGILTGKI